VNGPTDYYSEGLHVEDHKRGNGAKFYGRCEILRGLDSADGGQPRYRGSTPGRGRFLPFEKGPARFWVRPVSCSVSTWGCSIRGAQVEYEHAQMFQRLIELFGLNEVSISGGTRGGGGRDAYTRTCKWQAHLLISTHSLRSAAKVS
jgi:hypothetical protein